MLIALLAPFGQRQATGAYILRNLGGLTNTRDFEYRICRSVVEETPHERSIYGPFGSAVRAIYIEPVGRIHPGEHAGRDWTRTWPRGLCDSKTQLYRLWCISRVR